MAELGEKIHRYMEMVIFNKDVIECFPINETLLRNVYFENRVQMLLHSF